MTLSAIAPPRIDPSPIFEIFRSNHGTELLTTAVAHLGVFTRLAEGARSFDDLREAIGLAERPAQVLRPDVVGRVIRLCLSLSVVPVFVVPHEFGFQSMVENSNGTWQAKVWARFQHGSLPALQGQSQRYVIALCRHRADRIESVPQRRAFPKRWDGPWTSSLGTMAGSST